MPLKSQLKVKLEKGNIMTDIRKYKKKFNSTKVYCGVMDGDLYKSNEELNNENNISIQFNIDGIPMYNKSKYNIWPIQCAINELPPAKKKKIF